MNIRLVLFLATFVIVAVGGYFVIQYARGYRFDTENLKFTSTGILVATSNPDGAQVLINGILETATNDNIDLPPGTYDVQIAKEGFFTWEKRLTIAPGVVTKADALLVTRAASISPLTFSGVTTPILSPDGTKLAWVVVLNNTDAPDKAGIWLIELGNLPFGFNKEARQISDAQVANGILSWSQDSRNLILDKPNGIFLIDQGTFTAQSQLINVRGKKIEELKDSWSEKEMKERASQLNKLPEEVADILTRKSEDFSFSPDETKVLYTASGSATIPENLTPSLPGSSTQKQERDIKAGETFVYDIKEDRNFLVKENSEELEIGSAQGGGNSTRRLVWFSTSKHLLLAEKDKIMLMEYDGTNKTDVWASAYIAPFAFATPDSGQVIILTNFGAQNGELPNLYTIRLR
ncbi:PEGA domain-containing protein [Candidatus Microgenomates bacterium]|nr:PEGA domain-containing protein [Candidatus Microgenomates bacterium]